MNTLFIGMDISKNDIKVYSINDKGYLITHYAISNDVPETDEITSKTGISRKSESDAKLYFGFESTSFYGWHIRHYLANSTLLKPYQPSVIVFNPKIIDILTIENICYCSQCLRLLATKDFALGLNPWFLRAKGAFLFDHRYNFKKSIGIELQKNDYINAFTITERLRFSRLLKSSDNLLSKQNKISSFLFYLFTFAVIYDIINPKRFLEQAYFSMRRCGGLIIHLLEQVLSGTFKKFPVRFISMVPTPRLSFLTTKSALSYVRFLWVTPCAAKV